MYIIDITGLSADAVSSVLPGSGLASVRWACGSRCAARDRRHGRRAACAPAPAPARPPTPLYFTHRRLLPAYILFHSFSEQISPRLNKRRIQTSSAMHHTTIKPKTDSNKRVKIKTVSTRPPRTHVCTPFHLFGQSETLPKCFRMAGNKTVFYANSEDSRFELGPMN